MAFTQSTVYAGVAGDIRVAVLSCTADAVSGIVSAPGMAKVLAASIAPISMATQTNVVPRVKVNIGLGGSTALNGTVFMSGATNGDVFYMTIYGRG